MDYVGLKSIIDDDNIIKTQMYHNTRVVFPEAMKRLREKKLDKTIYDCHEKRNLFLEFVWVCNFYLAKVMK